MKESVERVGIFDSNFRKPVVALGLLPPGEPLLRISQT